MRTKINNILNKIDNYSRVNCDICGNVNSYLDKSNSLFFRLLKMFLKSTELKKSSNYYFFNDLFKDILRIIDEKLYTKHSKHLDNIQFVCNQCFKKMTKDIAYNKLSNISDYQLFRESIKMKNFLK